MAKARKTKYSASEWRSMFAQAAKWCAKNKLPNERIQDCIKRYLSQHVGVKA
jgi:hypothetical protein